MQRSSPLKKIVFQLGKLGIEILIKLNKQLRRFCRCNKRNKNSISVAFGLGWKLLRLRFVWFFFFFFFFSRVFERFECCGYCSCTVQWIVAANFDFSKFFGSITAHRVLFTDSQISLFSNFFIKNGSHDTIHTFKNYFAIVFFSFQFQFSVFSCIQTEPSFRNSRN